LAFILSLVTQQPPINLAVLISGSGTTLQNLIDEIAADRLNARIAVVIASKSGIVGIERAEHAGLHCEVINRNEFDDGAAFSDRVFNECNTAKADLVCLAGWLRLLKIPKDYVGRVINIHPALLPAFGGRGMYGTHVHQAVLAAGGKISGCTVHFVDDQYDHGKIILQRTCPVLPGDTPSTLARRVFDEEKIAYPAAIRLFQEGRAK
jgi:phosphoribosylglycinamide formyltransferase-1